MELKDCGILREDILNGVVNKLVDGLEDDMQNDIDNRIRSIIDEQIAKQTAEVGFQLRRRTNMPYYVILQSGTEAECIEYRKKDAVLFDYPPDQYTWIAKAADVLQEAIPYWGEKTILVIEGTPLQPVPKKVVQEWGFKKD